MSIIYYTLYQVILPAAARHIRPECVIAVTLHGLCLSVVRNGLRGGCAKQRLDKVEDQSDVEADVDSNMAVLPKSQTSVRHTTSQFMAIWTGPLAEFYHAQQKALGCVVEKMRLRFLLRGQLCCLANVFETWGREAMVLPPLVADAPASIGDVDTDIDTASDDTDSNHEDIP